MSNDLIHHLHQLDLDVGCTLDELRKAYRHLSFIWHPDRQPENYADMAKTKIQNINHSYTWLINHVNELQGIASEIKSKLSSESSVSHKTETSSCIRCQGSGLVAVTVNWKGSFEYDTCKACDGRGRFVVDQENRCQMCCGEGINPQMNEQDCESWIQGQLKHQGGFLRKWSPNEYKRQWLRFYREHMLCLKCHGTGYLSHRQDVRRKDRRITSAADFLRELQKKRESRKIDRRACPCGA